MSRSDAATRSRPSSIARPLTRAVDGASRMSAKAAHRLAAAALADKAENLALGDIE